MRADKGTFKEWLASPRKQIEAIPFGNFVTFRYRRHGVRRETVVPITAITMTPRRWRNQVADLIRGIERDLADYDHQNPINHVKEMSLRIKAVLEGDGRSMTDAQIAEVHKRARQMCEALREMTKEEKEILANTAAVLFRGVNDEKEEH